MSLHLQAGRQGTTAAQILTMPWLFAPGLAAVLLIRGVGSPVFSAVLLIVAYRGIALPDPWRRGVASAFFTRLRPVQMAIP